MSSILKLKMRLLSVFAYVLLLSLGLSAVARHETFSQLPFCKDHLELLTHKDINDIRDMHQKWLINRRLGMDVEILLNTTQNLTVQPRDGTASWREHWSDDFISEMRRSRKQLENEMADLVGKLRTNGRILESTTVHELVQCSSGRLNPHLYPNQPDVSFMLQYFRRPASIPHMLNMLENCGRQVSVELLVNVDSPEEGQMWANLSWSTRGRLVPVFSTNIHEIRAYNRMASLARGKVLLLLQDDDAIQPEDCSWLHPLMRQFNSMPLLGMVGLNGYRRGTGYRVTGNKAGGNLERLPATFHLFSDPRTGAFFTFPMMVDYAPMALRRAALMNVGGVDEGMSDAGECGILSDWELSIRMWAAGWHVGFMPLLHRVRVDAQTGSTHLPHNERRCWGRQLHQAGLYVMARWGNGWNARAGRFLELLENRLRILNLKTLQHNFTVCPFRKGCDDLEGNPPLKPAFKNSISYNQHPMVNA